MMGIEEEVKSLLSLGSIKECIDILSNAIVVSKEKESAYLLYLYRSFCYLQLKDSHGSQSLNLALKDAQSAIILSPERASIYLQSGNSKLKTTLSNNSPLSLQVFH